MINSTAFNGSFRENPFNFQHNNLNSRAVFLNGKSVPENPLKLSFCNKDFLEGYNFFLLSLFGFDLTPMLCHGEHQDYKQTGNLKILRKFSKVLSQSTEVLGYIEF